MEKLMKKPCSRNVQFENDPLVKKTILNGKSPFRLFEKDPIETNPAATVRLTMPAMYPDDRTAASEVIGAMIIHYRMTQNHLAMLEYAFMVRLYDEIHKRALSNQIPFSPGREN
jgi:hypothetical protein